MLLIYMYVLAQHIDVWNQWTLKMLINLLFWITRSTFVVADNPAKIKNTIKNALILDVSFAAHVLVI